MPATLYHYTRLETLQKIIESGIIHATHYASFEDKDELTLGIGRLLEAVRKHPVKERDIDYRDFLIQVIEGFREGRLREGGLKVYVLSLTEIQDSHHHWENYGDVAIGFPGEMIHKGFFVSMKHPFPGADENELRPKPAHRTTCRYDGTFDLAAFVADRFFNPRNYPTKFRHRGCDGWTAASLSVSVYLAICSIKGSEFLQEDEIRCMQINPDDCEYPVKVEGDRRFIEMRFDPATYIQELWVGPNCDRADCEALIRQWNNDGKLNSRLK
ncbi:MAG: hypothetical protein O2983_07305 [Planctomycetota bacterium]|nr:hypothetical protein [Planctomycetota bacterium]MDA0921125.1 hypothetical protein [Planctomycetota bacterium]MDA1159402.1 hypothetical protein [Planctomycetota bacterium]